MHPDSRNRERSSRITSACIERRRISHAAKAAADAALCLAGGGGGGAFLPPLEDPGLAGSLGEVLAEVGGLAEAGGGVESSKSCVKDFCDEVRTEQYLSSTREEVQGGPEVQVLSHQNISTKSASM